MLDSKQFGQYLKELRKTRKLTIRQLENASGVSNSYISQIEKGEKPIPSPTILNKLAEHLGVNPYHLIEKSGILGEGSDIERETNLINYQHRGQLHEMLEEAFEILTESNKFCEFLKTELQVIWDEYDDAVDIGFEFTPDSIRSLIDENDYESEWVWLLVKKLLALARKEEIQIHLKKYEEELKKSMYQDFETAFKNQDWFKVFLSIRDIKNYLTKMPELTYKGTFINPEDRQRILDMLKLIFPDRQ